MPVAEPTVALVIALLLHTPPEVVCVNVVTLPAQTDGAPETGAISEALTLTVVVVNTVSKR